MLLPHVLAATSHHTTHHTTHPGENDPTSWLLDRAGTYLRTHGQPHFRFTANVVRAPAGTWTGRLN
jgi:hypothetical protein